MHGFKMYFLKKMSEAKKDQFKIEVVQLIAKYRHDQQGMNESF